jgi:hypothetical protein
MPVIKGYLVCGMPDKANELMGHLLGTHIVRFKTNKKHFLDSYANLLELLEIDQMDILK